MPEENELGSENITNQEASNSDQAQVGQDLKKNKGDEESKKSVPFYKLFSFADHTDVALMIVGTIGAIGNGVAMPLMTIIFGEIINTFGSNIDIKETVHEVSKVCLKYVYLGMGAGVAAFFQVSCWMITGERQAARIRSLYLKTILRQDIAFFDQETNTGEAVERMSGDTVLIQNAMGEKVGKFTQVVATFIGAFVIAFIRGWLLALVMSLFIPPLVISGLVMSFFISKMSTRGQAAYSKAGIVVAQTIGSIRTEWKI